ncbi:serine/threonine-protein kinase [Sphaerimonospora mesophila]|uniref:serine/threonine-protein kinase n=1 Tax=Sphaerimonospora mesophila TaxID=37483 RepID=UPI0006E1B31C
MDLLAGRYRLVEALGEGGGGTVWRATDELLRREVAMKQVRIPSGLGGAELAEFTDRAIYEARAAGRLNHPSIVMIHDVVRHEGRPWIVMDLVPGRSLDRVIHEDGPLPVRRVAEIGLSVLDALEAAHARGILHRDVKPANVLIAPDGRALLTDFGIAARLGTAGAVSSSSAGSPAYMAPERFRGEPDGPPSDLWSLGATLYAAVEGRPPFERDLAAALVAAVLLHQPRPMALASPELAWLVHGLLDKDPARRLPPQVVRQALHALAAAPGPADVRRGRTTRLVLGIALVLVVGVTAGLGAWWLAGGPGAGSGSDGGRFTAAPDPCRSLTTAAVRELFGAQAAPDQITDHSSAESAGGPGRLAPSCQWRERTSGRDRTITVTYRLADSGRGEAAADAAALELAGQRAAQAEAGAALYDQPGIADEAFSRDESDPSAGTAGASVWFRLSNLVVEVAYRRAGDATVTPDDRRTAVRAAELVDVGLG